jgi:hypothetical protein
MKTRDLTIQNCEFEFKCTAKWEEMIIISDGQVAKSEVRFCDSCQKQIYFCGDDNELVMNVRLNRCVAVEQTDLESIPIGSHTLGMVVKYEDFDDDDNESGSDEIKK